MFRNLSLVLAAVAVSASAFGQATFIGRDGPYQIGYAANLNVGDSIVNLSNDGAHGGFFIPPGTGLPGGQGNLCINVYTFDPQEEEIACCACLVTPNGLNSLSVKDDLISNPLTPAIPTSVVIKLIATTPAVDNTNSLTLCNPGAAGVLRYGMAAWGVTPEPGISPGTYFPVNVPFVEGTLSSGRICTPIAAVGGCSLVINPGSPPDPGSELYALTSVCNFIQSNGSGFGICKSCRTGGLAGAKK